MLLPAPLTRPHYHLLSGITDTQTGASLWRAGEVLPSVERSREEPVTTFLVKLRGGTGGGVTGPDQTRPACTVIIIVS